MCHSFGAAIGAVAPRRRRSIECSIQRYESMENYMYIGSGILGTILLVLLIVWVMRRV
jgi:hypothetical protein